MKRARVIYNPSSGREIGKKNLPYILEVLERAGYEASAFATKGAGDAIEESGRAAENHFDLVVAAGGDGTIHEVINGLAEKTYRPQLGIIPIGTTNDFARALGIPRNVKKAMKIIEEGVSKRIDVGKMNDKYFINIAAGGSLTELTYEVPSKAKTVFGPFAYYVKGLEKMAVSFKPYEAEITYDGKTSKEDIMLFFISNSNSVGGFEKLAPTADLTDGLLEVLILKKCNIAEFGIVMAQLMNGGHVNDPRVIHFKTKQIEINTKRPISINLDGEKGGWGPCIFGVLKEHIEVMVGK